MREIVNSVWWPLLYKKHLSKSKCFPPYLLTSTNVSKSSSVNVAPENARLSNGHSLRTYPVVSTSTISKGICGQSRSKVCKYCTWFNTRTYTFFEAVLYLSKPRIQVVKVVCSPGLLFVLMISFILTVCKSKSKITCSFSSKDKLLLPLRVGQLK